MTSKLISPLNVTVSLDNLLHSFRRDGNGKNCLKDMVSDPLFDQLAKIPGGKPIVYSQEGKSPMNLGNN